MKYFKMINVRVKATFVLLLMMICIYGIVRDTVVMDQTVKYELMDFEVDDEENADPRVRLARAVHLTILGHKPKVYPVCSRSNPCGWELYKTPGRQIYGFLLNVCRCNPNASCIRDNDDLSTYTYQYRCHVNITEDAKFAPTEDIVQGGVVAYGNN